MNIPIGSPPVWTDKADIAATWEEGGFRRFALVGRSDVVTVSITGEALLIYPERSSGQKALVAALGLNEG